MLFLNLVLILCIAYLALCALLFTLRWKLIFHPTRANPFLTHPWKKNQIVIPNRNIPLHGWLFEHSKQAPFLIYFGGNAERVSYHFDNIHKFPTASLLLMSYRGYDETPGSPSQAALFSDALAVYDYVINNLKIPPSQIFLMGRSIGSSVAAYLASERSVEGLILITPFDRIASIVKQFFLFRPFAWLLRGNFNTVDYLQKANVNTLVLAAGRDEIVPKSSTENLVNACRTKITLAEIPAADHQNISDFPAYYEAIYRCLLTQNL